MKSSGLPGLEFWGPGELRASGTENYEVQWIARS